MKENWLDWITARCGTARDASAGPETVWPVRVSANAFGANVPECELYLSPDHAVFVNDVLVPVKLLINGTSIARAEWETVTYYHIELDLHDVILAEGLPVETYLDIGDRANFAGGATIRLFPDFATRLAPKSSALWEAHGVAPLVMTRGRHWRRRERPSRRMGLTRSGRRRARSKRSTR